MSSTRIDFKESFVSAIVRASKKFKNKDVTKYIELALYLLGQHVCPRCVLRLLGHSVYDDYSLAVPPKHELVAYLNQQLQAPGLPACLAAAPMPGMVHLHTLPGGMPIPGTVSMMPGPGMGPWPVMTGLPPPVQAPILAAMGMHRSNSPSPLMPHAAPSPPPMKAMMNMLAAPSPPPPPIPPPRPPPGSPPPAQSNGAQVGAGPTSPPAAPSASTSVGDTSCKRPHESTGEPPGTSGASDGDQPAAKRAHIEAAAPTSAPATPRPGLVAPTATRSVPPPAPPPTQECVCTVCLGVLQLLDGSAHAGSTAIQFTGPARPSTPGLIAQNNSGRGPLGFPSVPPPIPPPAPPPGDPPVGVSTGSGGPGSNSSNSTPFVHQPLSQARPEDIAVAIAAYGLTFDTFGIEISVSPSMIMREQAIHAHLSAKFCTGGVLTPWNPGDIILLKSVVRRMLSGPLNRGLSKQYSDNQSCDVSVGLVFEHPDTKTDIRILAEDQLRMRQRREQHRGKGGARQQQAQLPAPAALDADAAAGVKAAEREAAEDGVDRQLQSIIDGLNTDRTIAALSNMPRHIVAKLFSWPRPGPAPACAVSMKLTRAPLLLAGRYLKLRRNMPQTKWLDMSTGKRIGDISLAEHVEALVMPVYAAEGTKFISGGREDADVRMLGEGRPFVLEVTNPRVGHPSDEVLRNVEATLAAASHGAQVRCLKPCTRQALEKLKEAEESKEKTYQALCWCNRPLTAEDVAKLMATEDLEIAQDTPVRVLHRRAPKVRPKRVAFEKVVPLEGRPNYFTLQLRTQAGTYIKEFCHGDFGRTSPCVAELLGGGSTTVEILQLDVLAVHMDEWP